MHTRWERVFECDGMLLRCSLEAKAKRLQGQGDAPFILLVCKDTCFVLLLLPSSRFCSHVLAFLSFPMLPQSLDL